MATARQQKKRKPSAARSKPQQVPQKPKLREQEDYPFIEWESIEQHLDMCETGALRGDEILHNHGSDAPTNADMISVDEMMRNFHFDMAERDREGDEMSGDDHSSGLQGEVQPHIHELNHEAGVPGETPAEQQDIEELRKHRDDTIP